MLNYSKSEIIKIRIAPKLKAKIQREAKKRGVTMSELIRSKF
jgi:antitoxin component of RelBE/YafQ-DinJ toxin-antitoxin module